MDKPGQLLIVILIISLFETIIKKSNEKKIDNILLLVPLVGLCISTKTYFLTYLLLGLSIFIIDKNYLKNFNYLIFSKPFLSFVLILTLTFSHHFVATGCLISPLPILCFDESLIWARDLNDVKGLSMWVEQWSKAGASPTYVIENGEEYIKNFNWLSNWIEKYFIVKFLDQIAILGSCIVLIFFLLKKFSLSNEKFLFKREFVLFLSMIVVIFYIWFSNHPTLRYGGYSAFYLLVSFPFAFLFYKLKNNNNERKKIIFIIILVISIVDIKNIIRITKEFKRSDYYNFSNFPFFALREKEYTQKNFDTGLTMYFAHHCWDTPSPCGEGYSDNIVTYEKNGYYFIQIQK
ncbi:hypothetical protein [Candidatus Pelagibacter sp. HIMB1506]|uniref:hypothetical protein n=1 Tax=Candidatus Pelagibacter sp. HIMB1506 TaxID=3413337 RepID=UPI003F876EE2